METLVQNNVEVKESVHQTNQETSSAQQLAESGKMSMLELVGKIQDVTKDTE
ncbi:hypothetical protein [Bacillus sp. 2205SS5-2]|uniref:hypothetical protein n=1 Tax=Bacillus sp. 2205SS5-2 TaxID=3109031 RepID=UPI0030063AC9